MTPAALAACAVLYALAATSHDAPESTRAEASARADAIVRTALVTGKEAEFTNHVHTLTAWLDKNPDTLDEFVDATAPHCP